MILNWALKKYHLLKELPPASRKTHANNCEAASFTLSEVYHDPEQMNVNMFKVFSVYTVETVLFHTYFSL